MSVAKIPVVLHAHFYQPPRDNPWTETVGREPGAAPFLNWNARITAECYSANAWARVFGSHDRIVDVINNYAYLSFNVGPTLFSWLEVHAPETCRRIIEADWISAARNNGHGNAIAQAYSHAILPLCSPRDRATQIRWGIADFRHRFKRLPEAMWLPETGCNLATAAALAEEGMRYIILSPHQAARVRFAGTLSWLDVSDGSVDTRRPYRLTLPDGKSIACFFYDGRTSHAMSFGDALDMSRNLAVRLRAAASGALASGQLVHVATDGETYGHHRRMADRCLAYFATREAARHGLMLTNYGAYLDTVSVEDDVELEAGPNGEGTAWSCSHGLARWSRDCGCNGGRIPGASQAWRGPLRAALDALRDHAAVAFEDIAGELLRDVWQARDEYIDVILDPRDEVRTAFLKAHGKASTSGKARSRLFRILEAQRMTQLMYASCGWFFDDLAGLETVQILKYAVRATELVDGLTGKAFMPSFLEAMAEAKAHHGEEGTGADVVLNRVVPAGVTARHRAAQRASRALFSGVPDNEHDAAFELEGLERHTVEHRTRPIVVERVRVTRPRTEEAQELTVAATALEEHDMHCAVRQTHGGVAFTAICADLRSFPGRPTTTERLRLIDRHLGPDYLAVRDLPEEARQSFIEHIMNDKLERLAATYEFMYEEHARAIEACEAASVAVPRELRLVAEYTLARRLDAAVLELAGVDDAVMIERTMQIVREAREMGVQLTVPRSVAKLSIVISQAARALEATMDDATAERLVDLVALARALELPVALEEAQNIVFELARRGRLTALTPRTSARLVDVLGLGDVESEAHAGAQAEAAIDEVDALEDA